MKEGVFEEVGLDVEEVALNSGPAGMSAMQAGSSTVMPRVASVVANANLQGSGVKRFCRLQVGGWSSLWVGKDSPLTDTSQTGTSRRPFSR